MGDEMITTAVDDLLAYLKGKDKVAMQDAATVLNIPLETVQAWVDFLVEEKILGVEYKFTKPFIYLNAETQKEKSKIIERVSMNEVRQAYLEHARAKQIPETKIAELWRTHVEQALERKREYFIEQALRRRITDPEKGWQSYRERLLARC